MPGTVLIIAREAASVRWHRSRGAISEPLIIHEKYLCDLHASCISMINLRLETGAISSCVENVMFTGN